MAVSANSWLGVDAASTHCFLFEGVERRDENTDNGEGKQQQIILAPHQVLPSVCSAVDLACERTSSTSGKKLATA
ncbi:hypothetical protein [Acaryochloris marina]|uniref:Uncharacterized protein n=1 Tax=Acaryochloris marina (strain MBIC 11017) TaxID=329726 RepID=A8ZL64_ACAM1|nr:hypothetical protein [Acaryochloris marina]ABW31890.1 hypothetical protein AM1_B0168 [Acaryochloris marina MBIC11017]